MADHAVLVQNLKEALADVTETVTKIETLVTSMDTPLTTEQMDEFMDLGTVLDEQAILLNDVMTDAVWDFADENDDIDLQKYE